MFSFSTKCSVVSFREQTPFFVLGVKGKPKKSSSHTGLAFRRFQVNFIRFKEYHDLAPLFTVVFFFINLREGYSGTYASFCPVLCRNIHGCCPPVL